MIPHKIKAPLKFLVCFMLFFGFYLKAEYYPQYPQQEGQQGYYVNPDPYAVPGESETNVQGGDPMASQQEAEERSQEATEQKDLPENPVPEEDSTPAGQFKQRKTASDSKEVEMDFDHEDAFIDQQEAVRSEHYVRRAILSTIVNTTGKFEFNRIYLNHLMGFSAIYQMQNGPIKFTKYTSGMQGIALGYVTKKGHAFELGLEASAVSNVYGGYRYIWRPERLTVWPFAGLGIGTEMASIKLSNGPAEAENYGKLGGLKQMGFATAGLLIPIVEVGIKAEVRALFYGLDRMVLSQGLGLVVFL